MTLVLRLGRHFRLALAVLALAAPVGLPIAVRAEAPTFSAPPRPVPLAGPIISVEPDVSIIEANCRLFGVSAGIIAGTLVGIGLAGSVGAPIAAGAAFFALRAASVAAWGAIGGYLGNWIPK
jgi:hypothetical protein